jgi:hypothetical protein
MTPSAVLAKDATVPFGEKSGSERGRILDAVRCASQRIGSVQTTGVIMCERGSASGGAGDDQNLKSGADA